MAGFPDPALRGGYVASTFSSADDGVMMLEASGHSMVYVDREPRGGRYLRDRLRAASGAAPQRAERCFCFKPGEAGSRPG